MVHTLVERSGKVSEAVALGRGVLNVFLVTSMFCRRAFCVVLDLTIMMPFYFRVLECSEPM